MSKRSTILSFAILVVLLTAGAAQGLSGTNTVFSDDIASGEVKNSDLAADVVTTSKIRNGQVRGVDVDEGSLSFPCGSSAAPSFATIDESAVPEVGQPFATAGVQTSRNCSGQAVQVKRIGTGAFCVKFVGNPSTNAVLTVIGGAFQGGVVDRPSMVCAGAIPSVANDGEFQVSIRSSDTTAANLDFTLLAF